MSSHVIIGKKPSGHNVKAIIQNPGSSPVEILLKDGEFKEVMIHGDGVVTFAEVPKEPAA